MLEVKQISAALRCGGQKKRVGRLSSKCNTF